LEYIFEIKSSELDLKSMDVNEAKQYKESVKRDAYGHKIPTPPLNLELVMNKIVEIENLEEKREKLKELIESLSSVSCFREDLIFYLKRWIIIAFAFKHNFEKILFATSGHKVATQLLAQLAKGRGASISHEISYIDDKNFGGRINFMNPMREFLQKEIALYNYSNQVGKDYN
jgi:hypothetical protein